MTDSSNILNHKARLRKLSVTSTTSDPQHLSYSNNVEWAEILPGQVIVATEDRAWLYQPSSPKDRFSQLMKKEVGSVYTTKKLLDAAIATAKTTAHVGSQIFELTTIRWVWRLAGQYHLAHAYPILIEKAATKFAVNGHSNLAKWALQKAKEESGHDKLALLDIEAMGYDAEKVVATLVPPTALALIDYFTRSVEDEDPIDSVGYSYTMERLATGVDKNYIQKVEARLPDNVYATRCLRVHSNLGEDTKHVQETAEMVAGLTAKERVRIARACYETALLCFSSLSNGSYISNKELREILE